MANKKRYPGVNYFRKEDKDIFCGRKNETNLLFNKILVNRTVVLHGKSGTGKSSLVRAGLLNKIDDYNLYNENRTVKNINLKLLPIVIRGGAKQSSSQGKLNIDNDSEDFLLKRVLNRIHRDVKANHIKLNPLPLIKNRHSIWHVNKQLQLLGYELLLIFDQFEEFETYSFRQKKGFEISLAEVFLDHLPRNIDLEIADYVNEALNSELQDSEKLNRSIRQLEEPLTTKALFVVREDKLSVLSELSSSFPNILKNDFFLKQLNEQGAREAIISPAKLRQMGYTGFSFKYGESVVNKIISAIRHKDTGLFDPLEIQIICKNLERKIHFTKRVISEEDLKPINNIISEFYFDTWEDVRNELNEIELRFWQKRFRIINQLVISEKRVRIIEESFKSEGNDLAIVRLLEKKGFLRIINVHNENYYELSHDRLVDPLLFDKAVLEARDKANEERENEIKNALDVNRKIKSRIKSLSYISLFTFILLVSSFFIYDSYQKARQSEQTLILSISKARRLENPSFAYKLVKDYSINEGSIKKELNDYLEEFESRNRGILASIIPIEGEIVGIRSIGSEGTVSVIEPYNIKTWDYKTNRLKSETKLKNRVIKNVRIKDIDYLILEGEGDTLIIRDVEDKVDAIKIPVYEIPDGRLLTISSSGKYLISGRMIYDLESKKEIGPYPMNWTINDHDAMTGTFLSDEKYFIIGFWSGFKVIYRICLECDEKIQYASFISPYRGRDVDNSVVTSMVVDKNDNYLFAGDRSNNIGMWALEKFLLADSLTGDLSDEQIIDRIISQREIRPEKNFNNHISDINCLSLSNNDSLLLSGSRDQTAILWDVFSEQPISITRGIEGEVSRVNFGSSGTEYFIVSEEKKLFSYNFGKLDELYFSELIYPFNTFEYYVLGIEPELFTNGESVDKIDRYNILFNALVGLPERNLYPDDNSYTEALLRAITEIEASYYNLTSDSNIKLFRDEIGSKSFEQLNIEYLKFKHFKKPTLLNKVDLSDQDEALKAQLAYQAELMDKISDESIHPDKMYSGINSLLIKTIDYLRSIKKDLEADTKLGIDNKSNDTLLISAISLIEVLTNRNEEGVLQNPKLNLDDIDIDYLQMLTVTAMEINGFEEEALRVSEIFDLLDPEDLIGKVYLTVAYGLNDNFSTAYETFKFWRGKYINVENEELQLEQAYFNILNNLENVGVKADFEKLKSLVDN